MLKPQASLGLSGEQIGAAASGRDLGLAATASGTAGRALGVALGGIGFAEPASACAIGGAFINHNSVNPA